jgi:hypothetical protein
MDGKKQTYIKTNKEIFFCKIFNIKNRPSLLYNLDMRQHLILA